MEVEERAQTNLKRVILPTASSALSGDLRPDVSLASADLRPDVTTKVRMLWEKTYHSGENHSSVKDDSVKRRRNNDNLRCEDGSSETSKPIILPVHLRVMKRIRL